MPATQRGTVGAVGRGASVAATAAVAASGSVQASTCNGDTRQHHPRAKQHLLGEQSPDRRAGRSAHLHGALGGVVRTEVGGDVAAAARAAKTADRLPARDRHVGPQARRLGPLPLPRRVVPDQPFPHRLRPVARSAADAGGPGVSRDPALGGSRERGGSGRSVASTHRRRASDQPGRGDRIAACRTDSAVRHGGHRAAGRPE